MAQRADDCGIAIQLLGTNSVEDVKQSRDDLGYLLRVLNERSRTLVPIETGLWDIFHPVVASHSASESPSVYGLVSKVRILHHLQLGQ
jgi:hypothetical protein